MKYPVYNQQGDSVTTIELPEAIFALKMNSDLIYQAVDVYRAKQRQGTAHTKTRADVSGGGRKPWRQKGTGRARHGSTRSPIWVGGGVTFGPRREKVYTKELPKKMRRLALLTVLSQKAKTNSILILDKINLEQARTKLMAEMIANLRKKTKTFAKGSILLALDKKDDKIVRASRNIVEIKTIEARELNSLDLLTYKYLVMPRAAIEVIEKTFLKNGIKV